MVEVPAVILSPTAAPTADEASLIDAFRQDCIIRGFSKDTLNVYSGIVRMLYDFNDGDLTGVNEETLVAYLAYLRRTRHLAQKSVQLHFAALSTFYEFLIFKKIVSTNPVMIIRRRYLKAYKMHEASQHRQLISVEQASLLVNSILEARDKAVVVLLLKTGIRRHELSELDVSDIDMDNLTITLKPAAKRSNEIVYFDPETAFVLARWLDQRAKHIPIKNPALFTDRYGNRLGNMGIDRLVTKHAARVGLHNKASKRLEDKFTPHCCRHWFTTHLIRAGMPREFVQELRGDAGREAIDIYVHVDRAELKASYLAKIPKLGII